MLARLVPSLTGRPFTSLAASPSPTASGRAIICSTTRTRAKSTTPSFGRWLTNGSASSSSAGKNAPPTTRTNTWRASNYGAQFSPPGTCKINHKTYGRRSSGDYPEATLRLPRGSREGLVQGGRNRGLEGRLEVLIPRTNPPKRGRSPRTQTVTPVSYTHLRAHETDSYLVCRLLLEKKKK